MIESARAAWAGAGAPRTGPLTEAAHWLAVDAGGITGAVVDELEARGLDRFRYLETVGVVARLANIDFYVRGIGASPLTVNDAGSSVADGSSDQPTGAIAEGARITDGWVPAMGPLVAPFTLDALPAEGEALRAIHEPMYMPMAEMGDGGYADELTRAQIEYVASRTSYLNECFY